jgi:hypothetical protein
MHFRCAIDWRGAPITGDDGYRALPRRLTRNSWRT